ncbi:hypothetical protein GCM10027040_26380 [Halomonas shantousis]
MHGPGQPRILSWHWGSYRLVRPAGAKVPPGEADATHPTNKFTFFPKAFCARVDKQGNGNGAVAAGQAPEAPRQSSPLLE